MVSEVQSLAKNFMVEGTDGTKMLSWREQGKWSGEQQQRGIGSIHSAQGHVSLAHSDTPRRMLYYPTSCFLIQWSWFTRINSYRGDKWALNIPGVTCFIRIHSQSDWYSPVRPNLLPVSWEEASIISQGQKALPPDTDWWRNWASTVLPGTNHIQPHTAPVFVPFP